MIERNVRFESLTYNNAAAGPARREFQPCFGSFFFMCDSRPAPLNV